LAGLQIQLSNAAKIIASFTIGAGS
jgi:hypothetical protein